MIIPSFRRNLSSLFQQGPGPRVQMNSLQPPTEGCPGPEPPRGAGCAGYLPGLAAENAPEPSPQKFMKRSFGILTAPEANAEARGEPSRAELGHPSAAPGWPRSDGLWPRMRTGPVGSPCARGRVPGPSALRCLGAPFSHNAPSFRLRTLGGND